MDILNKLRKLSDEFYNIDSHYGWWFSDRLDEIIEEQEAIKTMKLWKCFYT